ncbi:hypothetical protein AC579_8950 [Pseudocercospora musae]|uniref:Uncharacterized protein n=1 Tax=Pseudocercospora musae TaxID=113226 RepID=A0A139I4K5_9PEZI|nr:hypothetical protein AC579_8950 [Pseudocercospora musae]
MAQNGQAFILLCILIWMLQGLHVAAQSLEHDVWALEVNPKNGLFGGERSHCPNLKRAAEELDLAIIYASRAVPCMQSHEFADVRGSLAEAKGLRPVEPAMGEHEDGAESFRVRG